MTLLSNDFLSRGLLCVTVSLGLFLGGCEVRPSSGSAATSPASSKVSTSGTAQSSVKTATSGNVEPLVLYSSRKTHLVQPLADLFRAKTGIPVQIVNGKAGVLIERLKREGAQTQADLFVTVDAGTLWYAAEQNLLQPLTSPVVERDVPAPFRDGRNRWVGLTLRARTLFYNSDKVLAEDLVSYENLGTPRFRDKLCLRTSNKVYNQSLVASLLDANGEAKTEAVVKGWVANLAKPVFTSDTLLLKAIDRGQCAVGIANSYYWLRLRKDGAAKNVKVFWPLQDSRGVHVNVSGAGVVRHSRQPEVARAFIEFLLSDEAQSQLAALNDEFPVSASAPLPPHLSQLGPIKMDRRPMVVYGRLQKQAIQLMDRSGYR